MWRLFQGIPRALRSNWGNHARPTPQVVSHEEEVERQQVPSLPVTQTQAVPPTHQAVSVNHVQRYSIEHGRRPLGDHGESGEQEAGRGEEGAEECEWWEWRRTFKEGFWHFHICRMQQAIDAVGWGTAVILGTQLTRDWKSAHKRHHNEPDKCVYHKVKNQLPNLPQVLAGPGVWGTTKANVLQGSGKAHGADWWKVDSSGKDSDTKSGQQQLLQAEATDTSNGPVSQDHPFVVPQLQKASPVPGEHISTDPLTQAGKDWEKLSQQYTNMRYNSTATKLASKGQHTEAVSLWQQAGARGYAKANFNLGLCYELGTGVKKDLKKAVEYYSRAAAEGHSKGMYNLAVMYLQGAGDLDQDSHRALQLMEQSAQLGLTQAQTELGVLYTEEGRRDMHKAVSLFTMAAKQKDSVAQYYLGLCHEQGWGVEQNECRAAELYRQASQAGHLPATHSLAALFETGRAGLPEDRAEALRLYESAARGGHKASAAAAQGLHAQTEADSDMAGLTLQHEDNPAPVGPRTQNSSSSLCGYLTDVLDGFGIGDFHSRSESSLADVAGAAVSVQPGRVTFIIGDEDTSDAEDFSASRDFEGMLGGPWAGLHSSVRKNCSQGDLTHSESAQELRALTCT